MEGDETGKIHLRVKKKANIKMHFINVHKLARDGHGFILMFSIARRMRRACSVLHSVCAIENKPRYVQGAQEAHD